MKILIVNYFYPPVVDAHAYRWEQIAKLWARNGHKVDVVTCKVHGVPYSNIESEVHVFRVGAISKKPPLKPNGKIASSVSKFGRVKKIAKYLYRKVYWPDSAWHWIPSVILEIFKKRHHKYDLVVSYYPCFAAHIGVAALRFFTKNHRFKWVADYGDPFCASPSMQPNNYSIYDKLNRLTERKLAKSADCLVLTNESTASAYIERLEDEGDIKVIPHLVDISYYYNRNNEPNILKRKLTTLTYVGGFHREVRKPDRLFDLIRRLNELSEEKFILNIYGPLNNYSLDELAPIDCKYISYKGAVARKDAVSLIQNAEIIVNVDNENCIMTPSKVVECISTGNPILNISNNTVNYEPLRRYEELGFALSLTQESISSQCALEASEFIRQCRLKDRVPLETIGNILSKHTLESVADEYLSLANIVVRI